MQFIMLMPFVTLYALKAEVFIPIEAQLSVPGSLPVLMFFCVSEKSVLASD